jgi:hypothetical protein
MELLGPVPEVEPLSIISGERPLKGRWRLQRSPPRTVSCLIVTAGPTRTLTKTSIPCHLEICVLVTPRSPRVFGAVMVSGEIPLTARGRPWPSPRRSPAGFIAGRNSRARRLAWTHCRKGEPRSRRQLASDSRMLTSSDKNGLCRKKTPGTEARRRFSMRSVAHRR